MGSNFGPQQSDQQKLADIALALDILRLARSSMNTLARILGPIDKAKPGNEIDKLTWNADREIEAVEERALKLRGLLGYHGD